MNFARNPFAHRRDPAPDPALILEALPVPVVLLSGDNRIRMANQAAEQFLGMSLPQLRHLSLTDLIPGDNPLFLLLDQVREGAATVSGYDLTLESPRIHKQGITGQASPLPEEPGAVVLVLQDASTARALDRQTAFRGAARSVSGMAAVLAHEVKNPLSGIRGAAQLLESSVSPDDRELAVLIRDEADRIRGIVDRMEMFSEKPLARTAVNIHRVMEHVRKLAQIGFGAEIRFQELYDPSLPPVLGNRDQLIQVVLNLVKNAAEAFAASIQQAKSCSPPAFNTACGWLCQEPPAASICRFILACVITAPAFRMTSASTCSNLSSAPSPAAAVSASHWLRKLSRTMVA